MQTQHNHLLRVLGMMFGLAAVVGSVVGQGILRSPGIVAQASGSPAVLIGLWALGAALLLLGVVLVAALSTGYLLLARLRNVAPEETIEWPSPS